MRNLTGDRCRCAVCGLEFNSASAFDKHRTGPYQLAARRCRSVDEMLIKGMALNAAGWWVAKLMTPTLIQARRAPLSTPEPLPVPPPGPAP